MFRLSVILILSFWLLPMANAQSEDTKANLAAAETQIKIGEYSKALLILEDILVREPDNISAQEMKINVLTELDRTKDAMRDIEEYIRMYPNRPEYLYLRALLNLQKDKYSRAIDDFDRALQMGMPEASVYKVYLNRGLAHYHNQDYDLAEADFNKVISMDPKNAAAYHGKGMVKYETENYQEAITEFQHALKLEGENAITHYNLAMSYFRLDDKENACYHFNKSCALGHRNACRLLMMQCDINIAQ